MENSKPSQDILDKFNALKSVVPSRLYKARINWFEPISQWQWVLCDLNDKFHLTKVIRKNANGTIKTRSGHTFTPYKEIKWMSKKKIDGEDSYLFDLDRAIDCNRELLKEDALNEKIEKLNKLQVCISIMDPVRDESLIDALILLASKQKENFHEY